MTSISDEFNDLLEIAKQKIEKRASVKASSQDKDLDKTASDGTLSVADKLLSLKKTANSSPITNEDILDALKWRSNAHE